MAVADEFYEPLYSLDEMTGREKNENRYTTVGFIEAPRRVAVLILVGVVTGVIPTLLAFAITKSGPIAVLFEVAWCAGIVWLFYGRAAKGLRQRNYQYLLDKGTSVTGQFMLGTAVVEVPRDDRRMIIAGSKPNPATKIRPADDERINFSRTVGGVVRDVFERQEPTSADRQPAQQTRHPVSPSSPQMQTEDEQLPDEASAEQPGIVARIRRAAKGQSASETEPAATAGQ